MDILFDIAIIAAIFAMLFYIVGSVVSYFIDDLYPPSPAVLLKESARALIRKTDRLLFWRKVRRVFKWRKYD